MHFIPKKVEERDPIKSKQYNEERTDIFNDIYDITKTTNNVKSQLQLLSLLKTADDFTIQTKLQTIQDILSDTGFNISVITLYNSNIIIYPDSIPDNSKAIHEVNYGRAILNILNTKVLYMHKDLYTGKDVIDDNIDSYINITNNIETMGFNIDKIIESDYKYMLDPNNTDIFLREYQTYDNIDYVDMIIKMNTINSIEEEFNTIYISPVPESSLTLDYLKYSNNNVTNSYFYNRSEDNYIDNSIDYMKKLGTSFDPIKITNLELRLKQTYKIGSNPYKYIMGLRNLLLMNHTYMNLSYIGFKIKVPTDKLGIMGFKTNLDNFPDNAEFKIYDNLDDFNNITSNFIYKTGDNINYSEYVDTNNKEYIYILVKMTPFNNINNTPELRNIMIEWK